MARARFPGAELVLQPTPSREQLQQLAGKAKLGVFKVIVYWVRPAAACATDGLRSDPSACGMPPHGSVCSADDRSSISAAGIASAADTDCTARQHGARASAVSATLAASTVRRQVAFRGKGEVPQPERVMMRCAPRTRTLLLHTSPPRLAR